MFFRIVIINNVYTKTCLIVKNKIVHIYIYSPVNFCVRKFVYYTDKMCVYYTGHIVAILLCNTRTFCQCNTRLFSHKNVLGYIYIYRIIFV